MDQLADLMLLADRYEVDSLKTACEHGLKAHIDHDSVLYFLSMGDQFNAKHLRVGNVKDYQYKWTAIIYLSQVGIAQQSIPLVEISQTSLLAQSATTA